MRSISCLIWQASSRAWQMTSTVFSVASTCCVSIEVRRAGCVHQNVCITDPRQSKKVLPTKSSQKRKQHGRQQPPLLLTVGTSTCGHGTPRCASCSGCLHRIDLKSAWSHYRKSRRHTLLVFSLDPPRCSSFHTPASFFHRYCNAVVEMSVSVHRSRVESSVKGVGRKNTRSPKLNFSPQDDGWRKIEEVEKTLVLKST